MIDKSLSQYQKKKKKKKPHQLVSKRKDGKRPGYYGSDAGWGDYDSPSPSPSSPSGNGSEPYYSPTRSVKEEEWATGSYTPPSPEVSVQDYMEDYATNVGKTASTTGGWEPDLSYDTNFEDMMRDRTKVNTTDKWIVPVEGARTVILNPNYIPPGGTILEDDFNFNTSSGAPSGQGRNWYADYDPNNTTGWKEKGLHMDSQGNESNPVDRGEMSSGEYQMKLKALETQNYMTNYGANVMKTAVPTGGFQRESTLSNILNPQNIKLPDTSSIKSFITEPQTGWKKAGKGVLSALAYGMFPGLGNMYLQGKGLTKLADRFGLTKKPEPVLTADTYGVKSRVKPPREPGGDGEDRNTEPKNVIESGQKLIAGLTMDQWRNIQQRRDLLEAYNKRGQLNEKGQMTLLEMNKMIEKYLV